MSNNAKTPQNPIPERAFPGDWISPPSVSLYADKKSKTQPKQKPKKRIKGTILG